MTDMIFHSTPRIVPGSLGTVRRAIPGLGSAIVNAVDLLLLWQARMAERRHLLELDERLLSDMGLSKSEAVAEAAKPFWRV